MSQKPESGLRQRKSRKWVWVMVAVLIGGGTLWCFRELDALQAEVDALKRLQGETAVDGKAESRNWETLK